MTPKILYRGAPFGPHSTNPQFFNTIGCLHSTFKLVVLFGCNKAHNSAVETELKGGGETAGGNFWQRRNLVWRHVHNKIVPSPPPCRSPPQGRWSPTTPWGMVTK